MLLESKKKLINKKLDDRIFITRGIAEDLPFKDEEFDIVYLWDILEHVKDPQKTVKEASRVCKSHGSIFIEFSPYWAYPTGHHLNSLGFPLGFLPYQLMPLSWTKRIVLNSTLKTKDTPEYIFKQFSLLNKLSIGKFKNMILLENLKPLKEYYFISLPNREIKISIISKIPILRELFTMSYSSVLQK